MSAFIQPDGSINPIFHSYLFDNNKGQLLTLLRLCPSVKGKTNFPLSVY